MILLTRGDRVVKLLETESTMVVSRGWEEGEMGTNLMGTEFQFLKIKKSTLETHCTTVWIYLT